MNKSASEIRLSARTALRGHWAEAAMLAFVYLVINGTLSHLNILFSILLLPLGWGFVITFLRHRRGIDDSLNIQHLCDGYKEFSRILPTLFMKELYVILWILAFMIPYVVMFLFVVVFMKDVDLPSISSVLSPEIWENEEGYPTIAGLMLILLLIIPPCIPAFVKSLSYSMTNYILYENEQMGTKAIDLSMKMMNGHRMELFLLHLSFIGWGILSILTLGIGYIWLVPYKNASMAEFYEYVKTKYDQNNTNNDEYQRLER